MVLGPIVQHRSLLRDSKANRKRSGRFASVVDRLCIRTKNYSPSGIPRTPAPIDVVTIHEQAFIEQPYFIERLSANHREASDDNIYGKSAVVRKVEHVLAREKARAFEYVLQSGRRTEIVPQCRKSSA